MSNSGTSLPLLVGGLSGKQVLNAHCYPRSTLCCGTQPGLMMQAETECAQDVPGMGCKPEDGCTVVREWEEAGRARSCVWPERRGGRLPATQKGFAFGKMNLGWTFLGDCAFLARAGGVSVNGKVGALGMLRNAGAQLQGSTGVWNKISNSCLRTRAVYCDEDVGETVCGIFKGRGRFFIFKYQAGV